MRNALLVLLVLAIPTVASAAQIDELQPAAGFPWGGTTVNIQGSDLIGDVFVSCYDSAPCPVTVLFGGYAGDVVSAAPSHVMVVAPAHARGTVDVTIRVTGRPDVHLANAFTFEDLAGQYANGDWTGYFIPVNANEVQGANGSIWKTELTVHNPTEFTVPLDGLTCQAVYSSECPRISLAPGETKSITLYPGQGESGSLVAPNGIVERLSLSLRVRDLSRQAHDFGTELPLLRVSAFAERIQRLIDVPTDQHYRLLLRTFSGSETTIVRIYPLSGNEVLDELRLERAKYDSGSFAIDPITPAVRASGHDRVRVVVEFHPGALDEPPYNGGWAFISLTNNQTQHVTIISPRR